ALLIAAIAAFRSWPRTSLADDKTKIAKLEELMRIERRDEMFADQMKVYKKQVADQAADALSLYAKQLDIKPGDPCYEQMAAAYHHFVDVSLPGWTIPEAKELYVRLGAQYLSEEDIDALISFYKSPAGQHALEAARQVGPKWQEIMGQKTRESLMKEF